MTFFGDAKSFFVAAIGTIILVAVFELFLTERLRRVNPAWTLYGSFTCACIVMGVIWTPAFDANKESMSVWFLFVTGICLSGYFYWRVLDLMTSADQFRQQKSSTVNKVKFDILILTDQEHPNVVDVVAIAESDNPHSSIHVENIVLTDSTQRHEKEGPIELLFSSAVSDNHDGHQNAYIARQTLYPHLCARNLRKFGQRHQRIEFLATVDGVHGFLSFHIRRFRVVSLSGFHDAWAISRA